VKIQKSRQTAAYMNKWSKCIATLFYNGPPHSPWKLPLPMQNLDPPLIHGSFGSPETTPQMATQSVQPFLQGSRSRQTERPTYRPSYCNNRLHLHSTAIRPNNNRQGKPLWHTSMQGRHIPAMTNICMKISTRNTFKTKINYPVSASICTTSTSTSV